MKAFADDKIDFVEMMISLLDRVEDTVGKGENVGYQHFLLFPQCFLKDASFLRVFKSPDCVVKSDSFHCKAGTQFVIVDSVDQDRSDCPEHTV